MRTDKPLPAWTDERVATLKRLWIEEGCSAAVVAAEIGTTRNAVIAKLHRLKVPPRGAPVKRARRRLPARISRPAALWETPTRERSDLPLFALDQAPEPLLVLLDVLSIRSCRWPIGDPLSHDFAYCGHRTWALGWSYCEHHHRAAYQQAVKRRAA